MLATLTVAWTLCVGHGVLAAPAEPPPPQASDGMVAPEGQDTLRVRIVSPEPGAPVTGRVSVAAEIDAGNPDAVQSVDFFVDGRLLFSDVEPPYELMWNSGELRRHRVEVVAYGPGRQTARAVLDTSAPDPGAAGRVTYDVRVERVEFHVRVPGLAPGSIDLDPDSFEVLEDGEPQPVVDVESVADLPLAVGMVVDHSGSMDAHLDRALEAGASFIEGLMTHSNDKAFLMAFADVPMVLQGFTNDVDRLRDAFGLIGHGRYTSLYDAVAAAADRFVGVDARRAVVLLTDGADMGSELDLREAIAAAQRADLAIYPVAVELSPRYFREQWVLRQLAGETGGVFFSLGRRDDVERIYERIAEDLRSQIRITYTPVRRGGSGAWREVSIRLRRAEEVEVRARRGYYAR